MEDKTYSVSQYNTAVQRYLKDKVPETWVHGVITQLNVRGRVAYITIGQFEENNPKPAATLQVFMWATELEAFNIRFSMLPKPFEITVELKVNLLLEADFYVPIGKFQPRVIDVDENFTLGELAQTRKKIIEALIRDGLLDKNKQLSLSPVPLHVGLITAPGSAAFRDFTTILTQSPFSFQVYFYPAKMQGEETENTVLRALKKLRSLPLDVVCLVRGGGAKTDLIYFDSEKICRAIADMPFPVLTGIGHEIDKSIADMVANEDKITPTDCAKFLEQRLQDSFSKLNRSCQRIADGWRDHLQLATAAIAEKAGSVKYLWDVRQSGERQKMRYMAKDISSTTRSCFTREDDTLGRLYIGLRRGPVKFIRPEREKTVLSRKLLHSLWNQQLTGSRKGIALKFQIIQSADPARQLEKGYSILRHKDGTLIRKRKDIVAGETVQTEISDGFLESKITLTREKK